MPQSPINDIPYGTINSPNMPFQDDQAIATQIDDKLVPRFTNANDRSARITNPKPGMYCHMLDDGRLWIYDSAVGWTWPKAAQGVIGFSAPFSSPIGLQDAVHTVGFQFTCFVAPNRRLRQVLTASLATPTGPSTYGFLLNAAAADRRRGIFLVSRPNESGNVEMSTTWTSAAAANITCFVRGSLFSGSSCSLQSGGLDGLAQHLLIDEGAAS